MVRNLRSTSRSAARRTMVLRPGRAGLDAAGLRLCLDIADRGGLIVFPTDTVYGIGCNAFRPDAIAAIYALKGRSYAKPLPILVAGRHHLSLVAAEVPKEASPLIDAFWPGPLTLVFKTAPMAIQAARGRSTIAVRVPGNKTARQILEGVNLPLATTSANRSGGLAAVTGRDAVALFRGKVDLIVDGGRCAIARESSVVDASSHPFTVLREGAISKRELEKKLRV